MPKLCPLKTDPEKVGSDCDELDCAWWDETCCAILSLGQILEEIKDIINSLDSDPRTPQSL